MESCLCRLRAGFPLLCEGDRTVLLRICRREDFHGSFRGRKTILDGMSVSWVAGDRVAVWNGERICNFRVDSSGVSSVIRGQAAETDDYIQKYPFNVLDSFSDGTFNMVVPSLDNFSGGYHIRETRWQHLEFSHQRIE